MTLCPYLQNVQSELLFLEKYNLFLLFEWRCFLVYKKVMYALVWNRKSSHLQVSIEYLYILLLVHRNFKLVQFIYFIAEHTKLSLSWTSLWLWSVTDPCTCIYIYWYFNEQSLKCSYYCYSIVNVICRNIARHLCLNKNMLISW